VLDGGEGHPTPTLDDQLEAEVSSGHPEQREPPAQRDLHNRGDKRERPAERRAAAHEGAAGGLERGDAQRLLDRVLPPVKEDRERVACAEQSHGHPRLPRGPTERSFPGPGASRRVES